MEPDPPRLSPPADEPPPTGETHLAATFLSVVALVVGLIVSGWLLLVSVAVSLCGLFGETCTPGEERRSQLAFLGAVVTFLGVPVLVALARRDARWLYAPFVEVIAGLSIATLALVF